MDSLMPEAQRNHGFNIREAGKPIITVCRADVEEHGYTGYFQWTHADIGVVDQNYKLQFSAASYVEKHQHEPITLKLKDNTCIKPVHLEAGKSYRFTVKSTYIHIYTHVLYDTEESQELSTDIKKPKIEEIYWKKNHIYIKWKAAEGAGWHGLEILDEEGKTVLQKKLEDSKNIAKCEMTQRCRYGTINSFVIEAHGPNINTEDESKNVTIGGDIVVTNVVGEIETREIRFEWKEAKNKTGKYEIYISETNDENNVIRTITSGRFYVARKLKSNYSYQCSVRPIYEKEGGDQLYSKSEWIKIPQCEAELIEKDLEFGTPRDIRASILRNTGAKCTIQVEWAPVDPGSNYEVLHYRVKILRDKAWWKVWKRELPESGKIEPCFTQWIMHKIPTGCEHRIEIVTTLRHIDTGDEQDTRKVVPVLAKLEKVLVKDEIGFSKEMITFKWDCIHDASRYDITIEDMHRKHLKKTKTENNDCFCHVKMTEELRIGQSCFVKVEAFTEEERQISVSDWKIIYIGDDKCPKNVTASHLGNFVRSLKISFELPRGYCFTQKYKISAFPADGRGKKTVEKELIDSKTYTFKHLRSSTEYYFEISIWNASSWSAPSRSNTIKTKNVGDATTTLVNMKNAGGSTATIRDTNVFNLTSAEPLKSYNIPNLGCVRDLKVELDGEKDNKDLVKVSWIHPPFEEDSDYQVITYLVKWQEGAKTMQPCQPEDIIEDENGCSCHLPLELGLQYNVQVQTIYEIIDDVKKDISEACKTPFTTRPEKPKIFKYDVDTKQDIVYLEWNHSFGAQSFRVHIYVNKSKEAALTKDVGKETHYRREFDAELGYGMEFSAKVIAYGEHNLTNTDETPLIPIGGDRVPTSVLAYSNNEHITDPSTQAFVTWKSPRLRPDRYKLEAYLYPQMILFGDPISVNNKEFLFKNLAAGTDYVFKVIALHNESPSNRSTSNKIVTDPLPMQVENVRVDHEYHHTHDTSTTQKLDWTAITDDARNGKVKYVVHLRSENNSTSRKERVDMNTISFSALEPDTNYYVKVRASNSKGSGTWSEECCFKTGFHKPKNLTLAMPNKVLELNFEPVKGSSFSHDCVLEERTSIGYQFHDRKTLEDGKNPPICFENFEPNQFYRAYVYLKFGNDSNGARGVARSNEIRTCPSKVIVTEHKCHDEDGQGCRQMIVGWNDQPDIEYYELSIRRRATSELENIIHVKHRNKVVCCCQQEAAEYSVQVRAKNRTGFGEPSEEKCIKLAPSKLRGILVEFAKDEKICIQCLTASGTANSYWMAVRCNEEEIEGRVKPICDHKMREDCITKNCKLGSIKWLYTPAKPAQTYVFELWAENDKGDKGQPARSDKITSKPSKPRVERINDADGFQTTNVRISWEEMGGCDTYAVNVFRVNNSSGEQLENSLISVAKEMIYNCRSPGSTYRVAICGVAWSCYGDWSEKNEVKLVPDKVELLEDVAENPVDKITIRWKKLAVNPDGYRIQLFCGKKEIKHFDLPNENTEFIMDSEYAHPGNHYHYRVLAFNKTPSGLELGRPAISNPVTIAWRLPELTITPDEEYPYHRAKIEWDSPKGPNFFELEIQNKKNHVVHKQRLENTSYHFEDGVPGVEYLVRLYCGYNAVRDQNCVERRMIMHPLPPNDIRVTADQDSCGLNVQFADAPSFRKEYIIHCKCLTEEFEKTSDRIKERRYHIFGLKPGALYEIAVKSVVSDKESHYAYCTQNVETLPSIVENLRSTQQDARSIMCEWDQQVVPPSEYIVQCKMNNEDVIEQREVGNYFRICDPEPGSSYTFRVKASNSSGCGRFSEWKTCFTRPSPPSDIRVSANQDNCRLLVEFTDTFSPQKEYMIQYSCISEGFENTLTSERIREHRTIISGLKPGAVYRIAVLTAMLDVESHYAYCIQNTATLPAGITKLRSFDKGHDAIMFEWDHLDIRPAEYIVQWKMNNEDLTEEKTIENNFLIRDPNPGSTYKLRVKAVNSSGCGRLSTWETYSTRPDPPKGLNAECLSPLRVKIRCDQVKRAEGYVFNVNGKGVEKKVPLLEYDNDGETELLEISVVASIGSKTSLPSKILQFKQTLLHLKKKFRRIARNQFTYIPLEFTNLQTLKSDKSFDCELSNIGQGETCLIVGDYFTGKTATCCDCIEKLPHNALGLYLDYEDFKENECKMSVETVLEAYMRDLHPDEISFALKWMKDKSELVVIFVENLPFSTEYSGTVVQYGDLSWKEDIFYNLISTKREIFPDARVIGTTRYKQLNAVSNATKSLHISGFGDTQIQKMAKEVCDENSANIKLNETLRYFSTNPWFCNTILKFLNMEQGMDSTRFSEILIKLLEDSMERQSYKRRIERLEEMVTVIMTYQPTDSNLFIEGVFRSPEMPSPPRKRDKVHEDIMKALYVGYFCSVEDFRLLLEHHGGIISPLCTGLLEKTRIERLKQLFWPIRKPPVEAKEKVKKLKEYLKSSIIQKYAYSDHQIALDLLQTIMELGFENEFETLKIPLKTKTTTNEIREVGYFLAKVQKAFCPLTEVTHAKDLSGRIATAVEEDIQRNPHEALIRRPRMTAPQAYVNQAQDMIEDG